LRDSIFTHLRHHVRFYVSALIGVAFYLFMPIGPQSVRLIAAGDTFFAVYMVAMSIVVAQMTAQGLCEKAAAEDEGIFLVVVIMLIIIVFACTAVISVLNDKDGHAPAQLALAIAAAPLGWLTLHTTAAFHYANLFYARDGESSAIRGGLLFPATKEPGVWEFLYYAFVVGMTAQVSDIQVLDTKLRRATLGHSIVSFFFNTAIIAMAVNAVIALATVAPSQ